MAPELIMSLIHDDGVPPITTSSDVYAFASVCLEVKLQLSLLLLFCFGEPRLTSSQIATGQLPYPNRTNDHAVTVDILRGVKPSRCTTCLLKLDAQGEDSFWSMLGRCWVDEPSLRPTMTDMLSFLESLDCSRKN